MKNCKISSEYVLKCRFFLVWFDNNHVEVDKHIEVEEEMCLESTEL